MQASKSQLRLRKHKQLLNTGQSSTTAFALQKRKLNKNETIEGSKHGSSSYFLSFKGPLLNGVCLIKRHICSHGMLLLAGTLFSSALAVGVVNLVLQNYTRYFFFILANYAQKNSELKNTILKWFLTVILGSVIHTINALCNVKLRTELELRLRKDLHISHIQTRTFWGRNFANQRTPLVPSQVLGEDIKNFSENIVWLTNNKIYYFSLFVSALCSLWQVSGWITLSLGFISLPIPYLILISLAYGYLFDLFAGSAEAKIKELKDKLMDKRDAYTMEMAQVTEFSKEVTQSGLSNIHIERLNKNLNSAKKLNSQILKPQGALSFMNKMHGELSILIGVLSSIYEIIQKKIEISDILFISANVKTIVSFLTLGKDTVERTKMLEGTTKRLEQFEAEINTWLQQKEASKLVFKTDLFLNGALDVRNFKLFLPHGKDKNGPLLNAKLYIKKGSRIALSGPNGCGKSTLFLALIGAWPFAKGTITYGFTKEKIHTISQRSYVLGEGAPLIDSILPDFYQLSKGEQKKVLKKITVLFEALGMHKFIDEYFNKIKEKDTGKKVNYHKELSGGERQKIEIIRAILKEPELLLIDEGNSDLDPKSAAKIKKLIKEYLPNTTVIAIDHQIDVKSKETFYDAVLKYDKANKAFEFCNVYIPKGGLRYPFVD